MIDILLENLSFYAGTLKKEAICLIRTLALTISRILMTFHAILYVWVSMSWLSWTILPRLIVDASF